MLENHSQVGPRLRTIAVSVSLALAAASIWTAEKLEGVAVAVDGQVYLVTDNDGLDDSTGETLFLRLRNWSTAFGR